MLDWVGPVPVQRAERCPGPARSSVGTAGGAKEDFWLRGWFSSGGRRKREGPGYFTSFSPFFVPICLGESEGQSCVQLRAGADGPECAALGSQAHARSCVLLFSALIPAFHWVGLALPSSARVRRLWSGGA